MSDIKTLLKKATTRFQRGQVDEADVLLCKALKINPENTQAIYMRGLIAGQRHQFDDAARFIASAIKNSPRHIYYVNLGLALSSGGHLEEALTAYRHATQLQPDDIESHNIQANILHSLGRFNELKQSLQNIIKLNPNIAGAHSNLGSVLLTLGLREESESSLRRAIELDPNYASAYCNLGLTLREMGHLVEAADCLQRSLKLEPNIVETLNTNGLVLMGLGRTDEAISNLRRAIELKPDFTAAHSNLLFVLAASTKKPSQTFFDEQRYWDMIHGREGRAHPMPARTTRPSTERKLRIGYVSPDFRKNVVSYFFEPLLSAHDRNRFVIYCYATHSQDMSDDMTERLHSSADHWRAVDKMRDHELAKQIHEDAIDILVDLTGHLKDNRLKAFTYRPAPIQACYLGYMASTGLESMDYWITDKVLHPLDTQEQSIENIYRLPRCWICYQPPVEAPEVSPCPSTNEQVTFGSFSNLSKLTSKVIETWSQLLHKLPGSRLLLMDKYLGDPKTQQLLIGRFQSLGITPERLLIKSGAPLNQYLATYASVDIVLDPFPRTGGTTTAEALWMGVPVITLIGNRYAGRISASKLTAIGHPDLIANSLEDYIRKAITLAHDPDRRATLRAHLRRKMAQSPLCNGNSLARAMESAYMTMWKQSLSKISQTN